MIKTILIALLFPCIAFGQNLKGVKKVLIVATSADNRISKPNDHSWGAYTPEIIDFYSKLCYDGFSADKIDIVSSEGGKVPLAVPIKYSKKYPLQEKEKLTLEQKLNNSLNPSSVDAKEYDIIYYSGGFSCLVDYPNDERIAEIASIIYENGGIVAAVCDGVIGLLPIKINQQWLLDGKTVSANRSLHEKLKTKGARLSADKVVADQRLVTGRGVKPIMIAEKIIDLLNERKQN